MSIYQVAKEAVEAGRLFLVGAQILSVPVSDRWYVVCRFSIGDECCMCLARTNDLREFKSVDAALRAINQLRGGSQRHAKGLECVF